MIFNFITLLLFILSTEGKDIKDQYVVVLKSEYSLGFVYDYVAEISSTTEIVVINKVLPNLGMFFIEKPSKTLIERMIGDDRVKSIDQDEVVYLANFEMITDVNRNLLEENGVDELEPENLVASCSNIIPYSFGLDRIDQRSNTLDCKPYAPISSTKAGKKVDVYVLDTGIQIDHVEFTSKSAGKVKSSWTYFEDGVDRNGHGTHVASTIGGANVGVAPKANIFSIKAIGDNGSGSYSNIVDSLDRIVSKKLKKPDRRIIVSMSLSGVPYKPANDAIDRATAAGVAVVVAAGNQADDACNYSPGSADSAITVGAINKDGSFANSFSNYGSCVDVLAPGNSINGACAAGTKGCSGKEDYTLKAGTSMATPHVAGVLALYMAQNRYPGASKSPSPELVKLLLQCTGSSNVITAVPTSTTDVLVYTPDSDKYDASCFEDI